MADKTAVLHQLTRLDPWGFHCKPKAKSSAATEEECLADHRLCEADLVGSNYRLNADCLWRSEDFFPPCKK